MKFRLLPCLLLYLFLFPTLLHAEEEIPAPLDFDRRDSESYRLEITPYGGDYLGDKLTHSFVAGGNLQFNLIPELAVTTDLGWSRASADRTSLLGAGLTDRNLYLISGGLVATKPAAYRSGKKTVEADFYTTLGGGIARFNGDNRGMGYFGGGMKTRFRKVPWFAVRVEVRNYLFSIPNPGGSDFEYDLTLDAGATFMLWAFP